MLKKNGMSYEDVNVVEMAPAEMPAALSENRIAGYVVAEPFGAMAVAMEKGKVIIFRRNMAKFVLLYYRITQDFIR